MPTLSRRWLCVVVMISLALMTSAGKAEEASPIKVFILAGQSNMEGKAKLTLLDYQAGQPATAERFKHLRSGEKWTERDDVRIKFLDRRGKLTVGFGSPGCIGPELEFGHVVGEHYEQPVLLIKTAWGGRSLYRDFRSPSAGLPGATVLDKQLQELRKRQPEATLDDVKQQYGASYREMLKEVQTTLADLGQESPEYAGRGYELAGFIWFQGWNDMIDTEATATYAENLAHFIRDVRRDLNAPKLPFVIGQMGVDGLQADANIRKFKQAQADVLTIEDWKDSVAVVKTDLYWDTAAEAVFKKGWRENLDEWNTVGSDYPYHYLGSPKTMCDIGHALAEEAIRLDQRANQ